MNRRPNCPRFFPSSLLVRSASLRLCAFAFITKDVAPPKKLLLQSLSHSDHYQLAAKDKEHRSAYAQRGPQIIELDRLPQKPDRERHEDSERNHLLQNFELRRVELRMPDPV